MTPKTLLIATDFSDPADLALEVGVQWAEHLGARIRVLHVADAWKESLETAYGQLATRTQRVNDAGIDCSGEILSRATPPAATDLNTSDADWVFIGTHGRSGLRKLALGSWAEAVIRTAKCPVISVPQDASVSKEQSTIVVGADLSPHSNLALDQLRSIGKALACKRFVLVHARPGPPEMIRLFEEQGRPLPPPDLAPVATGLDELLRVLRGDGYQADLVAGTEGSADLILRVAREESADLIAVGTHSRRGFPHLMFGSVAEEIVRKTKCPVYTTRQIMGDQDRG